MNTRMQRTILNWRWWLVLPIFVVLLPLAILSMLAEEMGNCIAPITSRLMAWTRAT